jgi:hypothetical protein
VNPDARPRPRPATPPPPLSSTRHPTSSHYRARQISSPHITVPRPRSMEGPPPHLIPHRQWKFPRPRHQSKVPRRLPFPRPLQISSPITTGAPSMEGPAPATDLLSHYRGSAVNGRSRACYRSPLPLLCPRRQWKVRYRTSSCASLSL